MSLVVYKLDGQSAHDAEEWDRRDALLRGRLLVFMSANKITGIRLNALGKICSFTSDKPVLIGCVKGDNNEYVPADNKFGEVWRREFDRYSLRQFPAKIGKIVWEENRLHVPIVVKHKERWYAILHESCNRPSGSIRLTAAQQAAFEMDFLREGHRSWEISNKQRPPLSSESLEPGSSTLSVGVSFAGQLKSLMP